MAIKTLLRKCTFILENEITDLYLLYKYRCKIVVLALKYNNIEQF